MRLDGMLAVLQVGLVVLKLAGVLTCSWWIVMIPLMLVVTLYGTILWALYRRW